MHIAMYLYMCVCIFFSVTNVDKNQLRFVKSAHQLNASVPNT